MQTSDARSLQAKGPATTRPQLQTGSGTGMGTNSALWQFCVEAGASGVRLIGRNSEPAQSAHMASSEGISTCSSGKAEAMLQVPSL